MAFAHVCLVGYGGGGGGGGGGGSFHLATFVRVTRWRTGGSHKLIFVASLASPSPEKKEMKKTFLLVTLVVASASASLPYLFRGCFWREGKVKYMGNTSCVHTYTYMRRGKKC